MIKIKKNHWQKSADPVFFLLFFVFLVLVWCSSHQKDVLDELSQTSWINLSWNVVFQKLTWDDNFEVKEVKITDKKNQIINYSWNDIKKYFSWYQNIILNFYDPNNTTCQMFLYDLNKNYNLLPSNTVLIRIDFKKYSDIAQKYKIKSPNMFVYLDNKWKIFYKKWLWITSLKEVLSDIKK